MQYRIRKPEFIATKAAAISALDRISPDLYAKTRNYIDGAVTYLSPYITHGLLSTLEVAQTLTQRHPLSFDDKLIFELSWREFFLHVYSHMGNDILKDIRRPCWSGQYAKEMPQDMLEARTGISIIDEGIRQLYETGYLHNHIRMWIASYTVHLRKVHWKAGADWMYGHLLDGDLASNHLSWQWVAGTFSHKPYVFNADNVIKYAKHFSCKGTAIDSSYEDMEAIARSRKDCGAETSAPSFGSDMPMLMDARTFFATHDIGIMRNGESSNQQPLNHADELIAAQNTLAQANPNKFIPPVIDFSQRDSILENLQFYAKQIESAKSVYWLHPWCLSLGDPSFATETSDTEKTLHIGWIDEGFFKQHPWSVKRWQFVWSYYIKHCAAIVITNIGNPSDDELLQQIAKTMQEKCVVHHTQITYNTSYCEGTDLLPMKTHAISTILPKLNQLQASFSRFYREATLIAGNLEERLSQCEHQQEA